MLSEYQNIALQFILKACKCERQDLDFLSQLLQGSPDALKGAIVAVPFLSVVDALNAVSHGRYETTDRDRVVAASTGIMNQFAIGPVTVAVADHYHCFLMLSSFVWNAESLFLEFSLSPTFVRLHADMTDFIERAEQNNDGFQ